MKPKREERIIQKLMTLSTDRSILWGIHIIKRIWPNYIYFYQKEGFGNPYLLSKVLEQAKNYFENISKTAELEYLRKELLANAPDSNEFPSVFSTYALDACAACDDLLSLIGFNDKEAIIRISELSINTVYIYKLDKLYVPSKGTDYPENEIYNSKEMLSEYEFQEVLFERIYKGDRNELIIEAFDVEYPSNINL